MPETRLRPRLLGLLPDCPAWCRHDHPADRFADGVCVHRLDLHGGLVAMEQADVLLGRRIVRQPIALRVLVDARELTAQDAIQLGNALRGGGEAAARLTTDAAAEAQPRHWLVVV